MNTTLSSADLLMLAPLLILLGGGLLILLFESFFSEIGKRWSGPMALLTVVIALGVSINTPGSLGPLLSPWLVNDALAHFFTLFFLGVGLASIALAMTFFQSFESSRSEYYFLLLSALSGALMIGMSADFLTLFIGIETMSIALYVLCGYMKTWKISHEAAIKYFINGAAAAAFLLYGIALVYGATGTTRLDALLPIYKTLEGANHVIFLSGIAFITVGLAFKAAVVPFHVWAPDVYEGSSSPFVAFLAVGSKAAAFAAFIRVFMVALPNFDPLWSSSIAFLAYPTLIFANFVAIRQAQLRRFFAYSGISHAGFMLMALAVGTPIAQATLLFYLVVYAFATLGAFAILASIDKQSAGPMVNDLRGLFSRAPIQTVLLAICLLTLAGIPPTPGFIAKFAVFKVAFSAGYYGLVIVGLLTAIISAFYYLRIIAVTFSDAPSDLETPPRYSSATAVAAIAFATLLILIVFPAPLFELLEKVTSQTFATVSPS
jgi:NADH-quinone oxidoreductase subunit N